MAVLPCMCSGFLAKIMEHMTVMSLHDITRFSHALERGNYKRGMRPSLKASVAAASVI